MKTLLFLIVLLVVALLIFYLATPKEATTENNQGATCDMSLWAHVYHGRFQSAGDRLQIINPCTTVSGVIIDARKEKDGDWHIQLSVDKEFSSLLNQANFERQSGYLVLEPICSNPVTQSDTLEEGVCEGFTQGIFSLDFKGRRVAVTGAYVIDRAHGWAEIHPVTSIVPID